MNLFGGDDFEGVAALIDKLEKSSFDYLKLEGDGVLVVIGKNGAGEVAETAAAPPVTVKPAPAPAVSGAVEIPMEAAPEARPDAAEQEGVVIVRSPSYGLFYAQPEPGAPPYVTVGAPVGAGSTVGLVEIMKTFNAVTAPISGVVTAIHVTNGETLEPDQPLISIKVESL